MQARDDATAHYLWRFQAGGPITGGAALDGEIAYLGCHDGIVYALNIESGEVIRRSQPLPGKIEGGVVVASVSGRRSVLVPCVDGALYLLDAATLAVQQEVRLGGRLRATPLLHQDVIYQTSEDGFVAAVDARTGFETARWQTRMGIKGGAACWGAQIMCAGRDGRLYMFDAHDSRSEPLWTFSARHQILATPLVDEKIGLVFFGALDETVYAVDRGGCQRWQRQVDGQVVAGATLLQGRLYVGTTGGKLYALDAGSGQDVWPPLSAKDWLVAAPSLWQGVLVCGCNDAHLYVIDSADGHVLWRFPAGAAVQAQPVITSTGVIIAATAAGTVFALPWHLCNYDEAAQWLELQKGREREAGEMWLLAGNQERAFACLQQGGAWLRLAEAASSASNYSVAANAYQQAASDTSTLRERRTEYWRLAAIAWDKDERPEQALHCRRECAHLRRAPLLVVTAKPGGAAFLGDHMPLVIGIRNDGISAADAIVVLVSGHVRSPHRQAVALIAAGAERLVTLEDIEPGQSGSCLINFDVEYRDANGRAEEPAHASLRLAVASRTQPEVHIHPEGDYVAGDKVEGDKAAGGQVKISRGEGRLRGVTISAAEEQGATEIVKGAAGPVCSACGQRAGARDKFCPNCGQVLLESQA